MIIENQAPFRSIFDYNRWSLKHFFLILKEYCINIVKRKKESRYQYLKCIYYSIKTTKICKYFFLEKINRPCRPDTLGTLTDRKIVMLINALLTKKWYLTYQVSSDCRELRTFVNTSNWRSQLLAYQTGFSVVFIGARL